LLVQKEAVRCYGILDYEERGINPHPALFPQGRRLDGNKNLLVIAPTSSGKTLSQFSINLLNVTWILIISNWLNLLLPVSLVYY